MNTRIWAASCAMVAAGVLGLSAQSPETAQSASAKRITVTGCIQRAAESPTGTSGTTNPTASKSEEKFLLTNTSIGSQGAAETAATSASAGIAAEYRLDADDAKVTPHVGHKVEIAGTIDPPPAMSAPEAAAPSATKAPKLKVDTIKMVAATCQ